MLRGFLSKIAAAAILVMLASDGFAETGEAVAVIQTATASGKLGSRTLQAGMPIELGETVTTGPTGQVEAIFSDDTKLVIGPNSSLVIESYLLRAENTVDSFTLRALGGSFRFITGRSASSAYSIQTTTALIGVRGTSLDFVVEPSLTQLALFDGIAEMCTRAGCIRLRQRCDFANARLDGDLSQERNPQRRNRQLRIHFPYVESQASLRPEFRVSTAGCGNLSERFIRHEPKERPAPEPREPRERRQPEPPNDGDGGPQID